MRAPDNRMKTARASAGPCRSVVCPDGPGPPRFHRPATVRHRSPSADHTDCLRCPLAQQPLSAAQRHRGSRRPPGRADPRATAARALRAAVSAADRSVRIGSGRVPLACPAPTLAQQSAPSTAATKYRSSTPTVDPYPAWTHRRVCNGALRVQQGAIAVVFRRHQGITGSDRRPTASPLQRRPVRRAGCRAALRTTPLPCPIVP
jgi:hypothetical protein